MSKEITVSLSGGGARTIPAGTPAREVLAGKLGKLAIGVTIDGQPRDLSTALVDDCSVEPILPDSAEGLDLLRHSTAHLMAHAVKRLFPEAQVTIGPVIENGFYYDFKFDRGFAPEDLEKIEAEMAKIVGENHPVQREDWTRDDAAALFLSMGEKFKVEIIRDLPSATVGPLPAGRLRRPLPRPARAGTGRLGAFKLLSVAGAYWRGDERNPMLQRIYGTAFPTARRSRSTCAASRRPSGATTASSARSSISSASTARRRAARSSIPTARSSTTCSSSTSAASTARYGYDEVITPQILDVELWHRSGHYENYRENMFFTTVEEREFAVKPMNCPSHCLIYARGPALVPRAADPLRGLRPPAPLRAPRRRARPDARAHLLPGRRAHLLHARADPGRDPLGSSSMIRDIYRDLRLRRDATCTSRRGPRSRSAPTRSGTTPRARCAKCSRAEGVEYRLNAGDGAFYGPKIDFHVHDALGR